MTQPRVSDLTLLDSGVLETEVLPNGIKIHCYCQPDLNVFQMEAVVLGGRSYERSKLSAKCLAGILKDGTLKMTSNDIADAIDLYGGKLKVWSNMDFITMSMSSLSRYAKEMIELFYDLYRYPRLAQEDLERFKKAEIERLEVSLTKNENVAYRHFTYLIFGQDHPYGYNSTKELYANVQIDQVRDHYNSTILHGKLNIFYTGYLDSGNLEMVRTLFGSQDLGFDVNPKTQYDYIDTLRQEVRVINKGEFQNSIMIGRRIISRNHPDFPSLYLTLMILGGYFGSRLMKVIREDLGLTYDISCHIEHMLFGDFFYINTDTTEVEAVLTEIYQQIEIIKTEKVPMEELKMVKNYVMGTFMTLTDGPFRRMQFLKSLVLTDFSPNDFNSFMQEMLSVDAEKIMTTANDYLQKENLLEVVVGNKK
ncbi:MAG: pitrilysin family protein [Saprospiraceae bacterium]